MENEVGYRDCLTSSFSTYSMGVFGIGDSHGVFTPADCKPRPTQELQVLSKWYRPCAQKKASLIE